MTATYRPIPARCQAEPGTCAAHPGPLAARIAAMNPASPQRPAWIARATDPTATMHPRGRIAHAPDVR